MNKASKQEVISKLAGLFSSVPVLLVVRPGALDASAVRKMRREIQSAGGSYVVAKNTLVRIALKNTPYESSLDLFKGPTALVYGEEVLSVLSVFFNKIKKDLGDKLEMIACSMEGVNLDTSAVVNLSRFSSISHLRAELLARMSAVPSTFVRLLDAYSKSLS